MDGMDERIYLVIFELLFINTNTFKLLCHETGKKKDIAVNCPCPVFLWY